MQMTLMFHILMGSLGILSGFVALYAAKGAPVHRKVGIFFVVTMLAMTASGTVVAAVRGAAPALNVPAGLLTAYLVVTGLTTIRPPSSGARWLGIAAMLVAATVGLISLGFGFEAIANGGTRKGMPAFPFFMFGLIGTLGSVGDLRMMRAGRLTGAPRIARHLWRMSFALFVAAMSFFIGQSDEFPTGLRIMPLLALPPLAVLATMLYWLWRVRFRRSLRGLVGVSAPETA